RRRACCRRLRVNQNDSLLRHAPAMGLSVLSPVTFSGHLHSEHHRCCPVFPAPPRPCPRGPPRRDGGCPPSGPRAARPAPLGRGSCRDSFLGERLRLVMVFGRSSGIEDAVHIPPGRRARTLPARCASSPP